MKIAFVILNYNTYQETKECIESIERHIDIPSDEYNITIVDNGSSDNSLEKLQNIFKSKENIDIISIEKNLGFARGNNVGIKHVNQNYSPEFVTICNSDIELFQDDFFEKLTKEYENSHFALLGPMMLTSDGRCDDSPWKPCTLNAAEKYLCKLLQEQKKLNTGVYYIFKAFDLLKEKAGICSRWVDEIHIHEDFWKYNTQVELQGAFLVFSKRAFEYIDGFDPRTFLYYEEQILFLKIRENGLSIVYDPQIAVYHKDGRATKKMSMTSIKKLKFITQCNIDSLKILIEVMRKNENIESRTPGNINK